MTLNNGTNILTTQKPSYIQHRSHLLVRSVSPHDTGVYRCDSDLTGEASVQVYVVAPEDLMKSLHLQGALEKSDSSKIFRGKVEEPYKPVTTSDTYSSFTSRVDGHGSNSFYDHPTKSHSQNYKKNQSTIQNIWRMSPSAPSSSTDLNVYHHVSSMVFFALMLVIILT
jgi:hypothetical protein